MNHASRMTTLNFGNNELIKITLSEVEDDYDVCIMDCSPGRFMLHDNIFQAADLLLIPNIPAPLSIYCNNMLMDELQTKIPSMNKVLSFYNMVQAHKNLHRQYLENRKDDTDRVLRNYIPFYTEIELITLTKESIFHQLKESRAHVYYHTLWLEICDRLRWEMANTKGIVRDIHPDQPVIPTLLQDDNDEPIAKIFNG